MTSVVPSPPTFLTAWTLTSATTSSRQSLRFVLYCRSLSDSELTPQQTRYTSPKRIIPGQWPDEQSYIDDSSAPTKSGSTFFTTAARFATSLTLEVFKLPYRLVQRFTRPRQIRVVSIIREDGASKKRLVDAGLAEQPTTPTRRRVPGDRHGSPQQHSRNTEITRDRLPSLWVKSPTPSPQFDGYDTPPHTPQFNSPQYSEGVQDDDIDDSLDWSMDDVDSGTPLHSPQTDSPTGMRWPNRKIISPNSQFAILKRSSVTPMRKQLLKKQLRAVEAVTATSPIQQPPNHTLASPIPHDLTISDLKKKSLESSVLSINAPTIAANAQEASAWYKAELEARQNQEADARATTELEYYSPASIDIGLSFLPDASSSEFEILHSPTPSPRRRKTVRWSSQSNVKPFYFDERISEMLDSTLESIRSPPPKPDFDDDDDEGSEDLEEATFEEPDLEYTCADPVDGPSLDDFLEESQLSSELLGDLQEDFKQLLALEPAAPPPPRPLVAPLSDEERDCLEDIARKSEHGHNQGFVIVPNKVTARDFGTLLPEQFNGSAKAWLNDEIVDQYLALLVKQLNEDCGFTFKRGGPAPPYHAFSSHWYNSVKGGVKNVERWAGRVGLGGKQYLDAKVVLYPICDGSHWRLLAVKPRERIIEYLDSLGWDGSKYISKLQLSLKHELGELYKADEWTVLEQQRSSRQLNGSDCGVFVLLNALVLLRGDDTKKVIACNGMHEARERMAHTIITGRPTTELDY